MFWRSDILFTEPGSVRGCVCGYRGYVNVEPHQRGDQRVRDFTTKAMARAWVEEEARLLELMELA